MLLDRVRSLWPPEITAISSGSYNWTRVATSLSLSVPTRPDYFPGGRRRGGDPFPQIASPPPLPEALLLPGFHAPSFQNLPFSCYGCSFQPPRFVHAPSRLQVPSCFSFLADQKWCPRWRAFGSSSGRIQIFELPFVPPDLVRGIGI
jgi:hypothetical protein